MATLKPLSEKNLAKQYAAAGIDEIQKDFLHKFFTACANLYGVLEIRDIWQIYKELAAHNDLPKLLRKDFIVFSGITMRETQPYSVFEIDDIYCDEPRSDLSRTLVKKSLVGKGQGKFWDVYRLTESQADKPFFVTDNLLSFAEERENAEAIALKTFLDNLIVAKREYTTNWGKHIHCEHFGQKLKDFCYYDSFEKMEIENLSKVDKNGNNKNAAKLEALLKELDIPASVKIFNQIKWRTNIGHIPPADFIKYLLDDLEILGVALSEEELHELLNMLNNYNNNTHLLCNRGWKPVDLAHSMTSNGPLSINFGPGMQKTFANGDLDQNELIQKLTTMGIKVL